MSETNLTAFGYAPGDYHCSCLACKENFHGDKHATVCKSCADAKSKEQLENTRPTPTPYGELETVGCVSSIYINDPEHGYDEIFKRVSPSEDLIPLVTRQNAEEVIAAERLKLEATAKVGLQLSERVEALEAENKRLREALETIAEGNFLFPSEFRFFARAALGEMKL